METPAFCISSPKAYAPPPKNMPCPNETMPPKPTSMFSDVAKMPNAATRMM